MPANYDTRGMKVYRRHTQTRARFIRVLAREISNIRGRPKVCECILKQAIECTNSFFSNLEINTCDWACDNHSENTRTDLGTDGMEGNLAAGPVDLAMSREKP